MIKRYNPTVVLMEANGSALSSVIQMVPCEAGIIVRWEDHDQAHEELKAENEALLRINSDVIAERDAALAELERRSAYWDGMVDGLLKENADLKTKLGELERRDAE